MLKKSSSSPEIGDFPVRMRGQSTERQGPSRARRSLGEAWGRNKTKS